MKDVQIMILEHQELADAEQAISHLQVEIEYHKKMLWSFNNALEKEENNLKSVQAGYKLLKDKTGEENENH